jgi:hypothetical protein
LIATLHEIYGRLVTDHDWPALAVKLPQSNNASANPASKPGDKSDIKCFRYKGNHHVKDCPKKAKFKDKDADNNTSEPAAKKIKTAIPAWRYVEPKDLTVALVDDNGKHWKFCTKCVCRQSGKRGLYLLSHFDSDHREDNFVPSTQHESNLASVEAPLGIPAATTRDPNSVLSEEDEDPIEFLGAWCSAVSNSAAAAAFLVSPSSVDDSNAEEAAVASDDDPPHLIPRPPALDADDLASLSSSSSVEREMLLQVEQDLFPGSETQAKVAPYTILSHISHISTASMINEERGCHIDDCTIFFFDWLLAPIALEHSADAAPIPFFPRLQLGCFLIRFCSARQLSTFLGISPGFGCLSFTFCVRHTHIYVGSSIFFSVTLPFPSVSSA